MLRRFSTPTRVASALAAFSARLSMMRVPRPVLRERVALMCRRLSRYFHERVPCAGASRDARALV